MVETTGIDKLGESLLSQAGSRRAQLRRDLKKDQKRQQKALLIGGALKFLDNAVGERYNNWATSEANLTASRLLKRNQKMQAQREKYETELANSNLSPMDYEMKLVQDQLTPELLKQKVPDLSYLSEQDVSEILFGTDSNTGLYKELAKTRLDARNTWAGQIKDFDYETAISQWKKVNPYSKNLIGGAFNFLKGKLGDTPNNTPEQRVQESLDEIKQSNADLQSYYDARNSGLSTEDAVKKIKERIKVADYKRIGKRIETIKDTESFTVTMPNGNIETVQATVYKNLYRRADDSFYMETVPYTDGTKEENERSRQFVNSRYAPIKQTETTTDPLTGLTVNKSSTYFLDSDRSIIAGRTISTIDATSQANQRIISSPTRANLAEGKDAEGYDQLVSIWGTLETFEDHKSVEAYINNLPSPPKSDSEAYKAVTLNMGANLQIIKRQLESNYDLDALGFNETDQFKIAGQLLLIDAYAEGEQGKIAAGSTFKGRSTENVDAGKLILAIDLLRSNRQLQFDALPSTDPTIKKNANIITDDELRDRLYNSKFFEINNNAFSLNEKQDNVAYYDAEDIQSINELQARITKLGGSASILQMTVPGINPETGKAENYTVLQWMTKQDMPDPSSTKNDLNEENKDNNISENIQDSAAIYLGGTAQTLTFNNGKVSISPRKIKRGEYKGSNSTINDIEEGPLKDYLIAKQQELLVAMDRIETLEKSNEKEKLSKIAIEKQKVNNILNIVNPATQSLLSGKIPGPSQFIKQSRMNFFLPEEK